MPVTEQVRQNFIHLRCSFIYVYQIYGKGKMGTETQILLKTLDFCQNGEGYIISHRTAIVHCVCIHRFAGNIFVEKVPI